LPKRSVVVLDVPDDSDVVVATRTGRVLAQSAGISAASAADWVQNHSLAERYEVDRVAQQFADDISAHFSADADGKLADCNQGFLDCFGFASKADAVGSSFLDRFPTQLARDAFLATLRSAGRVRQQPVVLCRVDGQEVHAVQNVVMRTDTVSPTEMRGYIADRTEERRLQLELQRWQRVDAIGRLAGGVAHDFNNLLTVILGYVSTLERRLTGDQKNMMTEARLAAERAAELTARLLAFGRRQTLRVVPLELDELIRAMIPLVSSVIGGRTELELSFESDGACVRGDAAQLERAILNLVMNARDAMPEGGQLAIRTRSVQSDDGFRSTFAWAKAQRYVVLEVSDSGTGMSQATLEHLFDPFFTTKSVGQGTGLGLASAEGIVEQHDGAIVVRSAEGSGSTFFVYLPQCVGPAQSQPSQVLSALRGGTEKLVIAEDEASVRRALVHSLRARGYEVLEVENGEQALELALGVSPPALCVLDIVMPGIGGLGAYERLRLVQPNLPVILTSGYSGELPGERFARDRHSYFVPKPYSPEAMIRIVRTALDRHAENE
jgi:signal transduction histidine kinase